jgi:HK97 family phage prohead protease
VSTKPQQRPRMRRWVDYLPAQVVNGDVTACRFVEGSVDLDAGGLRGCVVPYGVNTAVGGFMESFAPGVFAASLANERAVPLLAHHDRYAEAIGRSLAFVDGAEGLVGSFAFNDSAGGQAARQAAHAHGLTGLSVGFRPMPGGFDVTEVDGVEHVVHRQAILDEVSLVTTPAYLESQVLEVRGVGLLTPDMAMAAQARSQQEFPPLVDFFVAAVERLWSRGEVGQAAAVRLVREVAVGDRDQPAQRPRLDDLRAHIEKLRMP